MYFKSGGGGFEMQDLRKLSARAVDTVDRGLAV